MKHSAYRSLQLAKEGKTKKRDGNLRRWIDEDWRNLTPYAEGLVKSIKDTDECGKRHPEQKGKSVCRPMKNIIGSTPETADNYSKKEIQKAVELKNKGKRIIWNELKGGMNYHPLVINKSLLKGGSVSYALGDDDIRELLPNAKIIQYDDLDKYGSIEQLLPKNNTYAIILYESEQNSGHWVCILRYDDIIEFFCSYGSKIDEPLNWISDEKNEELGQADRALMKLLKKTPLKVVYNKYKFQKEDPNIATCGRHTISRIQKMLEGYNLQEYINWFKDNKPKNMTNDEFIDSIIKVEEN